MMTFESTDQDRVEDGSTRKAVETWTGHLKDVNRVKEHSINSAKLLKDHQRYSDQNWFVQTRLEEVRKSRSQRGVGPYLSL